MRFIIGDTIRSRPMFDDKEITFQISKTPNLRIAGAELLEIKARQFARLVDFSVGEVSKSMSKVSESMFKAAKQLRDEALKRALPFFGGLTKSGKRELTQRTDDVQPQFSIGMTDDPTAIQLNRDIDALLGLGGVIP